MTKFYKMFTINQRNSKEQKYKRSFKHLQHQNASYQQQCKDEHQITAFETF